MSRTFDGVGNVTGTSYHSGLALTMTYDPLNRLNEILDGTNLVVRYATLVQDRFSA